MGGAGAGLLIQSILSRVWVKGSGMYGRLGTLNPKSSTLNPKQFSKFGDQDPRIMGGDMSGDNKGIAWGPCAEAHEVWEDPILLHVQEHCRPHHDRPRQDKE